MYHGRMLPELERKVYKNKIHKIYVQLGETTHILSRNFLSTKVIYYDKVNKSKKIVINIFVQLFIF